MKRFVLPAILILTLLPLVASAEYLGNIRVSFPTPSHLDHGTIVDIDIDYKVDHPDGALIFARPFTNGSLSPGYGASGGPFVEMGTGTVNQFFTLNFGDTTVDQIRVDMRSPDQSETYLEIFIPVTLVFSENGIFNIEMNHGEYSRLPHGEDLVINFDYGTNLAGGCRIYARPFTNGSLTPGYGASGSIELPAEGSYSQYFSFDGDADVDHIRFQIWDLDNNLQHTIMVPYDIHWRVHGVYDFNFNWPNLASLHNSQDLVSSFTLDHGGSGDLRVWMWTIVDGNYAPGSVYQGSVAEPTNPHVVTRYSRVNTGTQRVDAVRFLVGSTEEIYQEFDVPVVYYYAPHALQNFVFTPASPAIMSNEERLDFDFDYLTDEDEVRIFARPAFDGEALFGISSAGSPLYPGPSGVGDFWYTFADGMHEASAARMQMVSPDQSVLFLEYYVQGQWLWGSEGAITGVDDAIPVVTNALGMNYPNPFNPSTSIPVSLARDAQVKLSVYDVRGRLVQTMQDGSLPAGQHVFQFHGEGLGSGAYICRLETPTGVHTQRMTLLK